MSNSENPAGVFWAELPVTSQEWPLARPAPSKTAFAEFLARDLGITEPAIQRGLWSAIAFSAQWLLVDEFKRPDSKTLRRRLTQIESVADKLLNALSKPYDAAQDRFYPTGPEDIDYWLYHAFSTADPHLADLALSNVYRELQQLKQLIATTHSTLSETGSGRRKDQTLWTWVEHLSPLWALYSNRPLTVDYHEGVPITPYALFMHQAVRMLDPEREPKLPSILDRYRTQQNRAKTNPNIPE